MKASVLTAVAILIAGACEVAAAADPQIAWSRNLYESFVESTRSGKPLVVYFTATDCGFCKQLERGVFNEPEMAVLAGQAEFVWADTQDEDDKGNYAQLRRDLKIDKLPSVVVIETSSEHIQEMGRIVGYFPLEEFISNLQQILDPRPADVPVQPTL